MRMDLCSLLRYKLCLNRQYEHEFNSTSPFVILNKKYISINNKIGQNNLNYLKNISNTL